MEDPILDAVGQIVARIAGAGRTPADVTRDTRLADGYWLDSVELLEVVIACETTFGVTFDGDQDAATHAFDTLGTLADLVRTTLASRGA